jgi:hypothetical protein
VPRAALAEGGSGYPAQLSVILVDTLAGTTTRRDTVLLLDRASERYGDGYLRTHITFPVDPSGEVVHRVVVRDTAGEAGSAVRGTTVLRSYAGEGLRISDLVIGEPDSAGSWQRGDTRLTFALPRAFGPNRPFTVYYEVYGVTAEATYRTELRVEPVDGRGLLDRVRGLFGGGPGTIDLRFEDVAPSRAGIIAETRRLGADLPPGHYRLFLGITDGATGQSAVTEIRFEVVG